MPPGIRLFARRYSSAPELTAAVAAGVRGSSLIALCGNIALNDDRTQVESHYRNYSARVPMGRMAEADEIPGAVVCGLGGGVDGGRVDGAALVLGAGVDALVGRLLASDAASYVTGQVLAVDGGLTAW